MDCSPKQAPLSMEFWRQEYWSGLPFPFSRGSSQPRDQTWSPAMQADSLLSEPPEVFKEYRKMLHRKRSRLSLNIYYDHNYVKKTFLYCKKSKMLISLYLKPERINNFLFSFYLSIFFEFLLQWAHITVIFRKIFKIETISVKMDRNTTQIKLKRERSWGECEKEGKRSSMEGLGFRPAWKWYHQVSLFLPPPNCSAQPPLCGDLIFFHIPSCQRIRLPTALSLHHLL